MGRVIGSIVAGWTAFLLLGWLSSGLVLHVWPAYAAAYPERAFTLPMQLARLGVGAVLVIIAGATISAISRHNRQAIVWGAIIPLVETVWVHLHEPTWSHYPVWYHIVTFCLPIPCALFGAWLQRARFSGLARNAG
ncbi:MAG: hypothetical protein ACKOQ3_11335 [Novosphingobium sp.]